ncbi:meiosis mei2 [Fusarium tjaetaba]|uniref:Meiosis mei2 n=1 Tax=Fusarium tjaetaba TaxID=1567544 RepID=A0A8H5QQD9_9HYPO|nr:meiosis mei2 [Fusarium tjaetaba]KAF5617916.1 meiosis mei2 [Fusarium tjaetaba]
MSDSCNHQTIRSLGTTHFEPIQGRKRVHFAFTPQTSVVEGFTGIDKLGSELENPQSKNLHNLATAVKIRPERLSVEVNVLNFAIIDPAHVDEIAHSSLGLRTRRRRLPGRLYETWSVDTEVMMPVNSWASNLGGAGPGHQLSLPWSMCRAEVRSDQAASITRANYYGRVKMMPVISWASKLGGAGPGPSTISHMVDVQNGGSLDLSFYLVYS